MEIGISVGACHTLAAVLLIITFLASEQTLVKVGDTHVLERDIGQVKVDILEACDAYLTVETEFNKRLLTLGQCVAIDDIEVGAVLIELYFGEHEVKTHLIINLLHLEIDGKTVLLSMCN